MECYKDNLSPNRFPTLGIHILSSRLIQRQFTKFVNRLVESDAMALKRTIKSLSYE